MHGVMVGNKKWNDYSTAIPLLVAELFLVIPGRTIIPGYSWAYNYSWIRRKRRKRRKSSVFGRGLGLFLLL